MNHPRGESHTLIDFACRKPCGSMRPTNGSTRQAVFCPSCQFSYRADGCLFTPTRSNGQAFGKNASGKALRDGAPRREPGNNLTGGTWTQEAILDVIVEYYERHADWPLNTTTYRDDQRLPHSATVKRHLGSVKEAVRLAKELMEKERKKT